MDIESRTYQNTVKKESWRTVLTLAYQSLGVVYGDLSISPLYVFKSTFAEDIEHSDSNDEIFGVLSFIFWTITLVPLFKYVFIVLRADDNGEGGTFALYSLLCRHARVNSLPSCQLADEQLTEYKTESPLEMGPRSGFAARLKSTLEKRRVLQKVLLVLALIGTCMVIGDGVLTPAISVFSAVSGVELSTAKEHHKYIEVPAACVILIGLFALQHYGTHRVGFLFAPIAFTSLVYPSLILAYMGQAAYLSQHHVIDTSYNIGFYVSVPEKLRWPVLVIAILAAVVGSQAIITGTFSIIKQCSALGCFPKVKIVHTSSKIHGQIYIPEINWLLMVLCLAVTIGFRDTKRLGNASGLAVITVMLVTTCLMSLVIVLCWHKNILFAIAFVVFFGTIESLYFTASLIKFLEGAWVPVALSLCFLAAMCTWHYGTLKRYEFDVQNKVSVNWLLSLGQTLGIKRVRGVGLIHTELVSGVPAIFSHFVTNLPAFHQVLVFLCVKSVPVPHVRPEERFLVGRVGPKQYRMYRCIVRYGYRDVHKDDIEFEGDLVCSIAEFVRSEAETAVAETNGDDDDDERMSVVGTCSTYMQGVEDHDGSDLDDPDKPGTSEIRSPMAKKKKKSKVKKKVRFIVPETPKIEKETREELMELTEAREGGVAYIMGNAYMRAKHGSGLVKRVAINVGYEFLRRNTRGPRTALTSPHASTLEVGMIYHV
ncbi:hypothetical protein HID58_027527 [Brassica napus]|uniref:Potassium transporter n=1 Tax=Brassica napus TaxID=3708 RepID=A0ABQ8CSR6_BRANA|nr:hypothetical protein HID58_027527 [Brassica napus]